MPSIRLLVRGGLSALAAGVLLTNGCTLTHAPLLGNNIGKVEPANYCPGDTVTARYDITAPDTCVSRPGLNCATLQPTITTASTPESFPAQTVAGFANRIDFVPTADAVDVSFSLAGTTSPQRLIYPTLDAMGAPVTRFADVRNNTARTTRINGSGTYDLVFSGVCNGPQPGHAPATLPGPPAFSAHLHMDSVCNPTSSTLLVNVAGTPVMLPPGGCQNPVPPGSTTVIPAGAPVTLLSAPIDPAARCSSVEGGQPPADIRLRVTMTCG
ncbi:MAG: hypothetical protein ACTHOH_18650 [Lysobacteraceae bacterium]